MPYSTGVPSDYIIGILERLTKALTVQQDSRKARTAGTTYKHVILAEDYKRRVG